MATFRVQKRESYVVLDKGFLNNPNLSWQAKGLLAYMLALPNDWVFNIEDLKKRSTNGRDATRTTINELSAAGYIYKAQPRNENGKFGKGEWIVNELPFTENPFTVNPSTEKPVTENPTLLINKELNNKELNNKQNNDDDKGNSVQAIFRFHEENGFGVLNPFIAEKISAWIDDLNEELVLEAMKIAVENNVIKWKYVESILLDWSNKKLKTLADVEADNMRQKAQKQQKPYKTSKKPQQVNVPEWFDKRDSNTEEQVDEAKANELEARRQQVLKSLNREES